MRSRRSRPGGTFQSGTPAQNELDHRVRSVLQKSAVLKKLPAEAEEAPRKIYGRKRDRVYLYVRNKILTREFRPGAMIDPQEIADTLDVSRTPIQEALTRLEQEGFIEIIPQVGIFVRTPTSEELFEKLISRAVLEGLLTKWATPRIGDEELRLLEELAELMNAGQLTAEAYSLVNREFHNVIHVASGLHYVRLLVEHQWNLVDYTAVIDFVFQPENMRRSSEDHLRILTHLKNREADEARKAMEAHVMRVAHLLRERWRG
ncbi:MAG: GntR family transcriptional regulator [Hydrogenibacillus schlegelii]|uniref:GntR family transcriptional regulator n=2 Tax=Hydrogenibacillus schlegelii TaxID=1484 RepID=A0A947CZI8_HYDSH|nr:GntR family transcriptional regulator [Hydrogenibacillus schlegelii]